MMLLKILLASLLASLAIPAFPAQASDMTQALSHSIESPDGLSSALIQRLATVCAKHPEVERAFVVPSPGPDGSLRYIFVPIFDRKVSDQVLKEAQVAYHEIYPFSGEIPIMLLERNNWKKTFGGTPAIYVRARR